MDSLQVDLRRSQEKVHEERQRPEQQEMSDLVAELDFPGEQEALLPMFTVRQCAQSYKKAANPADTILRRRISIPAS